MSQAERINRFSPPSINSLHAQFLCGYRKLDVHADIAGAMSELENCEGVSKSPFLHAYFSIVRNFFDKYDVSQSNRVFIIRLLNVTCSYRQIMIFRRGNPAIFLHALATTIIFLEHHAMPDEKTNSVSEIFLLALYLSAMLLTDYQYNKQFNLERDCIVSGVWVVLHGSLFTSVAPKFETVEELTNWRRVNFKLRVCCFMRRMRYGYALTFEEYFTFKEWFINYLRYSNRVNFIPPFVLTVAATTVEKIAGTSENGLSGDEETLDVPNVSDAVEICAPPPVESEFDFCDA